MFHKSERNKGQVDDQRGRDGKKGSNVQHDASIEEEQKASKHQEHCNEKFIRVDEAKQWRNFVDWTPMDGFDDQSNQILSDFVLFNGELVFRAYKLDVKLVIILVYLVLNVVKRQHILF